MFAIKKHVSPPQYEFNRTNCTITLQKEEVTDWRKNVDAMSGMEGRKKLFNAGQ